MKKIQITKFFSFFILSLSLSGISNPKGQDILQNDYRKDWKIHGLSIHNGLHVMKTKFADLSRYQELQSQNSNYYRLNPDFRIFHKNSANSELPNKSSSIKKICKQIILGELYGFCGFITGGAIGSMFTSEYICLLAVIAGSSSGYILGTSYGVYIAGNGQDEEGAFGVTLGGSMAGALFGFGITNILHEKGYDGYLPIPLGTIIGSIACFNYLQKLNEVNLAKEERKKSIKPEFLFGKRHQISLGLNYSDYTTTNGNGQTGLNLSIYRETKLLNRLSIKYGICYSNKKIDLKNKRIRSDSFSGGMKLYNAEVIHCNHHIFELNLFLDYQLLKMGNFSLSPLFGGGYAYYFGSSTELNIKSTEYADKPVENYDYEYANEPYPIFLLNSGWIIHTGMIFKINRYHMDIYYSHYLYPFERANSTLMMHEKLHSLNLSFGISF